MMASQNIVPPELYSALSQFLYREAALLDARDWDGWDSLFCAESRYWMPVSRDQRSWTDQVSLVNDYPALRKIRLERFKENEAASLQGKPSSSHLISNIVLATLDDAAGRYTLYSRFVVAQFASWGTSTFHGSYTHDLLREGREFKISLKRVDLVNAQGPLGDIVTIL